MGEGLRQRLAANPVRHRVLLLLDEPDASMWNQVLPLLRFGSVHTVLAAPSQQKAFMAESDASAGAHVLGPAAHAAMASGLKPVSFELGPLEPLAQVRLFLRRAPRPLSVAELHCKPRGLAD